MKYNRPNHQPNNLHYLLKTLMMFANSLILIMISLLGLQTYRVYQAQKTLAQAISYRVPAHHLRQNLLPGEKELYDHLTKIDFWLKDHSMTAKQPKSSLKSLSNRRSKL